LLKDNSSLYKRLRESPCLQTTQFHNIADQLGPACLAGFGKQHSTLLPGHAMAHAAASSHHLIDDGPMTHLSLWKVTPCLGDKDVPSRALKLCPIKMISPPESAAHVPLNLKSVFVEAFPPESYGNGGEKLGNSSLVWSVLKKNSTRAVREARAARKPTPRIIKTITIHTLS